MKASRRSQPYRSGAGPLGATLNAMRAGRTGMGGNPQDLKRAMAKRHGKRRRRRMAPPRRGAGLASYLASTRASRQDVTGA